MLTNFVLVVLLQVNPIIFGVVSVFPTEEACNKAMVTAAKENQDNSTSFTCLEWVVPRTEKPEVKPVQKKEVKEAKTLTI